MKIILNKSLIFVLLTFLILSIFLAYRYLTINQTLEEEKRLIMSQPILALVLSNAIEVANLITRITGGKNFLTIGDLFQD